MYLQYDMNGVVEHFYCFATFPFPLNYFFFLTLPIFQRVWVKTQDGGKEFRAYLHTSVKYKPPPIH